MTSWKEAKLSDICSFRSGLWKGKNGPFEKAHVIRNTNFTDDGLLSSTDIAFFEVETKQLSTRRLKTGDIILEKSGGGPKQPVGRVSLFECPGDDYSFSNFTAAIRPEDPEFIDNRFLHKFLHWVYLSGVTEKMQSNSTGIRNLNLESYKSIRIPLPPKPEQLLILSRIDEAFTAIQLAKLNTDSNLKNAQEILNSSVDELFLHAPVTWPMSMLMDEIDLLTGFPFKSIGYTSSPDDLPLLRGDNIHQGYLRWEDVKRWPSSDADQYDKFKLRDGDVVLAMDRPWVKAGLKRSQVHEHDLPCALVQRTARLRSLERLDQSFLYYLVSSSAFTNHLLKLQTGSGVPHISGPQIGSFSFRLPSISEQKRLVARLNSIQKETRKMENIYANKLIAFEELKKSILQAAFSGNL